MTVTFFGHRYSPTDILQEPLKKLLIDLIENQKADKFYVGNKGFFDALVKITLTELQELYPEIEFYVVLAYFPYENDELNYMGYYENTIVFDGINDVHPKFAIDKRNKWMVDNSDIVITYVVNTLGGAYKFKEYAKRKGKTVINLADLI